LGTSSGGFFYLFKQRFEFIRAAVGISDGNLIQVIANAVRVAHRLCVLAFGKADRQEQPF